MLSAGKVNRHTQGPEDAMPVQWAGQGYDVRILQASRQRLRQRRELLELQKPHWVLAATRPVAAMLCLMQPVATLSAWCPRSAGLPTSAPIPPWETSGVGQRCSPGGRNRKD